MPSFKWLLRLQPVLPPGGVVPGDPVLPTNRSATCWWLLALGVASVVLFLAATGCSIGCAIRSRRSYEHASHAGDRARRTSRKIYRRYGGRHFATLKSALLQRSILRDLQAGRDVPGAERRVVRACPPGSTIGVIGRNGSGKSTALKLVAGITKPTSGHRDGARPHFGADRARRRVSSGDLRPRERLHQRHHARPDEARDRAALRRDRRVRRARGLHRRAGQDLLVRHVHAAGVLRSRFTSIRTCCSSTRCWPSATRASRTSASTSSREFKRRGKTILLVTHSLGLVERFCDEAVWLDAGRKRARGRSQARDRRVHDGRRARRKSSSSPRPTTKAQHEVGRAPPAEAAPAPPPTPAIRPPTCRRRPKAAGAPAASRSRTWRCSIAQGQPTHVFHSGEPMHRAADGSRRAAGRGLRLRRRHLQRRRRVRLRHEHRHRGIRAAVARGRRRGHRRHSRRSIWSKARTSSTSPSTSATARRTTITACCTRSASSRG